MNRLVRDQLWIVLAASIVFFTNLGMTGLWDLDEPLYASCAREMLSRGDWVVPRYNGEYFYDKPPLMFWTMMLGFQCFGDNVIGARFFSAVLGIATALAVYHIGRLLYRREVGFWAGIITASTIIFTVSARAATVDAALTLVSTLVMLAFVVAGYVRPWRAGGTSGGVLLEPGAGGPTAASATATTAVAATAAAPLRPRVLGPWLDWLSFVVIYALMGVAVLAKGPVGLLLPLATLGLYGLIVNQTPAATRPWPRGWLARAGRVVWAMIRPWSPRNFLRTTWQLRPITAAVVVAAVALPWFYLVDQRTNGQWLHEFFGKYNLGPFVKPFLGHKGPFVYHFVVVLIGFFPWSVFLGPALVQMVRRLRAGNAETPATIFLACWAGVWFGFWSVCSTKLPHYVLPAYPALAVLTACFMADWAAQPTAFRPYWWRNALVTFTVVGAGLLIALPIVAAYLVPGEGVIGLIGVPLLLGAAVCWHFHRRQQWSRALAAFTVASIVFVTGIFAFVAVRIDRHQHSEPLAASIRSEEPAADIAAFNYMQASMVYYVGHPIPRFDQPAKLDDFVHRAAHPYVVTNNEDEAELLAKEPGRWRVVARRPWFLSRGEVVVLAPQGDATVRQAAAGDDATRK